jgi:hypothetical protein
MLPVPLLVVPAAWAQVACSVFGGLFLASEALGLTKRLPVNSVTEIVLVLLRGAFRKDAGATDRVAERVEAVAEALGEALLPPGGSLPVSDAPAPAEPMAVATAAIPLL